MPKTQTDSSPSDVTTTTADRFAAELRESGLDECAQAEAREHFEDLLDELGQA